MGRLVSLGSDFFREADLRDVRLLGKPKKGKELTQLNHDYIDYYCFGFNTSCQVKSMAEGLLVCVIG